MEKIKIDDFAKFKYLSNPTFSKNGKYIAFNVSEANIEKNNYNSYIYLIKDKKTIKLTNGGKERSFFFLDDENIIFQSDRNDSKANGSKFYVINVNGGEASLKFEFPISVSKLISLKNGDFLVLGSLDKRFPDIYLNDLKYIQKAKDYYKDEEDYEIIEENPWWWNGQTFTKGISTALYYFDSKKNKLKLITDIKYDVSDVFLKEDESLCYILLNDSIRYKDFTKSDLYKLDLKTFKYDLAIKSSDLSVSNVIYLKNRTLLLANKLEYGINTNVDIYSFDTNSNKFALEKKLGEAIGSSVGSDIRYGGGRSIKVVDDILYFISTRYEDAYLYQYKDNEITLVIDKPGSIDSFDVCKDKLVMVALYDMQGQELYNESLDRISNFNTKLLKNKFISIPEAFIYQGEQNELHGFVLKPYNYDPSKKYPAILDIHGGPKTVYGNVFYHEMQYWASLGFFVIYTNPTGSDGRGNEFADIRGKYGTVDYNDLMTFCDEALKRYPQIDKSNFFETGGSYGGFMTNWIIGHTNRFKACVSQRSISNWFSFYGISDIGVAFAADQQASTPFTDYEKLWFHSPMKYANLVKTPTLFIHSNEDYRCPMSEGMQMLTALLSHNVEAKMVYFKGENHDLSRSGKPKHRIKRLKEITNWFESHLSKE